MAQHLASFLPCKTIGQLLARRAAIDILSGHIDKVLFAEAAICFRARSHRLWQRHCDVSLLACQNLHTAEVAAIGDNVEMISIENLLRLRCDLGKLRPVRTGIRHLMRDDQMMLRIHSYLHVVPDDTRATPACRHRTRIRISQRNLLIARQLGQFLLEMCRLGGQRFRWLLPVGGVELAQVARYALLNLCEPTLHLRAREILVTIVDRFELAAINGDARGRQQAKLPAKRDKPRTHLADRWPAILAKISNCLVIGNQPTREPHHLNVTSGLALKPPARLNPVEVAVDVELQQY